MQRENKHSSFKFPLVVLLFMMIIVCSATDVLSLSFDSAPSINGGATAYTANDLVCMWSASADTVEMNVSWYNSTNLYSSSTVVLQTSTLGNQFTKRDDLWKCEVTLWNGTDILSMNTSIGINNTAPSYPFLVRSGITLSNYYELYEDVEYTIYINASDNDNDVLKYYLNDEQIMKLCASPGLYTGLMSCNASHSVLRQSATLGAENATNYTVTITARENSTTGISTYTDFIFTLIPVNDRPYFTSTIAPQSINAGQNWSVLVQYEDEEENYPINVSLWSDLNDIAPGLLIITSINNTYARINFSANTTNVHAGTWNVSINITEAATLNVSTLNFTLQINVSNFNPVFTNSFANITAQNWTQGGSMLFYLNATDVNTGDNLTFNITAPTNASLRCNISSPWIVQTLNNSALGAVGLVNITNITNNHVACRYVNFVVYDPYGGIASAINVFLNITNVNDAPIINEVGINGNMSNLSYKKFQVATYAINASDPDNYTYQRLINGILTFSTNDSRFPVNNATGIISIYPNNDSFIGNWNVNVTASDGYYQTSRLMRIEIRDNSVPILNLSQNNIAFLQNNIGLVNFSVNEIDNETVVLSYSSLTAFSDSIYTGNFQKVSGDYSLGTNLERWRLNLTRGDNSSTPAIQRNIDRQRNDLVGNHLIEISFADQFGAYRENISSGIMNITILNSNDAPFFDGNRDNVSDAISFANIVYNYSNSFIINVTDFDLYLINSNESLTFSYSNASAGIQEISFVKLSSTSANFTFKGTVLGSQSVNITVTDAQGLLASQIVSFTVESRTPAPVFHSIRPYFNSSLNSTIFTFTDIALYPNNITYINFTENTSVIFDAVVTNASTEGNFLTFYWYVDGILRNTTANVTCGINSSFIHYFDFFSSNQTHNITLRATDYKRSESIWTWIATTTNINRKPIYCPGTLQNLSIEGTSTITNYVSYGLKQRFYDPDDDPLNTGDVNSQALTCDNYNAESLPSLTFSINPAAPCVIADFTFIGSDLKIVPTNDGVCLIEFVAEDDYGESADSEVMQIIMTAVEGSGQSSSSSQSSGQDVKIETVTVPVMHDVDVPSPIELVAPGFVDMYTNKTIYITIKLKNTWTTDINGIQLFASSPNISNISGKEELKMNFTKAFVAKLPIGAEVETTLILTNYRKEGPFEVIVSATVQEPKFNDSTSILISAVEQLSEGDQVKVKVTFAKDLLSENSVCRELNELLDRAQAAAEQSSFDEALKLVDGVINGCKYLMEEEQVRRESPSMIRMGFDKAREYTLEILAGAGLLLILTLTFHAIASLKKKLMEK
jgi:hypothetical protein